MARASYEAEILVLNSTRVEARAAGMPIEIILQYFVPLGWRICHELG